MTEKRYIRIVDHTEKEVRIFDTINEKKIFNIFFNELDSAICLNGALTDVVDLLNELHEENEQSKMMIATLRNIVLENEDLEKENQYIKNTIQEAYNTERTHIGQSVLKQLIEAIQ